MDIPLAKQEELFERYKQTERAKHLDAIAEEANRAAEKASKEADLTHDAEDAVFWAAHDLAMELNQVAIHAAVDFINDWQVYLVDSYLAELGMEQAQAEFVVEEAQNEEAAEQCASESDSIGNIPTTPHSLSPDGAEVREYPQTRQHLQRSEARGAKGCGDNTPPCVVQGDEHSSLEVRECSQTRQRLRRSEARSAKGCGVSTPPCVEEGVEAQSRERHQPNRCCGPRLGSNHLKREAERDRGRGNQSIRMFALGARMLGSPALSLLLLLLAFVVGWFGDSKPSEADIEANIVVVNPQSVSKCFEGARLRSIDNTGLRRDYQPAPN